MLTYAAICPCRRRFYVLDGHGFATPDNLEADFKPQTDFTGRHMATLGMLLMGMLGNIFFKIIPIFLATAIAATR